ncbi:MAG: hypothetical protein ABIH21_04980 [Patescibacteria group bacterium]
MNERLSPEMINAIQKEMAERGSSSKDAVGRVQERGGFNKGDIKGADDAAMLAAIYGEMEGVGMMDDIQDVGEMDPVSSGPSSLSPEAMSDMKGKKKKQKRPKKPSAVKKFFKGLFGIR